MDWWRLRRSGPDTGSDVIQQSTMDVVIVTNVFRLAHSERMCQNKWPQSVFTTIVCQTSSQLSDDTCCKYSNVTLGTRHTHYLELKTVTVSFKILHQILLPNWPSTTDQNSAFDLINCFMPHPVYCARLLQRCAMYNAVLSTATLCCVQRTATYTHCLQPVDMHINIKLKIVWQ